MTNHAQIRKPFWGTVSRGICGRCPNCGEGKLFRAYLKPVEQCSACSEQLGHIRADDGPAWLTITLVAHLIAPVMLAWLPGVELPMWLIFALISVPTVALMLLFLPLTKGFFIACIWRTGCVGAGD